MARRKRQYGSGCLLRRKGGWALRWRETAIGSDGTRTRVLRYESLGEMSRKQAGIILAQRVVAAGTITIAAPSTMRFQELASQWLMTVLPMYKHSTQKNHRHILGKHLMPRFGDVALTELKRQDVQAYVAHLTQRGYAPKTVDHIHDVLSAILRTAVKWGHLEDNPARGVDLPRLTTVRPKWALTVEQAAQLLTALPTLAKTLVGLALVTGLRRGELFGLRWRDIDDVHKSVTIREAVYEGVFDTPQNHRQSARHASLPCCAGVRPGLACRGQADATGGSGLRHADGEADLAEQCPSTLGCTSVRGSGPAERHVADVPAHVLVLVARGGRAEQGDRRADGARDGRHDAEHLHPGHAGRPTGGRQPYFSEIVPNCSLAGGTERANSLKRMAPQAGLEPATLRLTAGCSAN